MRNGMKKYLHEYSTEEKLKLFLFDPSYNPESNSKGQHISVLYMMIREMYDCLGVNIETGMAIKSDDGRPRRALIMASIMCFCSIFECLSRANSGSSRFEKSGERFKQFFIEHVFNEYPESKRQEYGTYVYQLRNAVIHGNPLFSKGTFNSMDCEFSFRILPFSDVFSYDKEHILFKLKRKDEKVRVLEVKTSDLPFVVKNAVESYKKAVYGKDYLMKKFEKVVDRFLFNSAAPLTSFFE